MTLMTNNINLLGRSTADDSNFWFCISSSHSHHDLAMSFFDSKIRENFWEEFVKAISCNIGFIYISSIEILKFFVNRFFPITYSNKFSKPLHNSYINRSKFENSSVMQAVNSSFCFDSINVKTAIAINVSSKISKVEFFNHIGSFSAVYIYNLIESTVNDLASRVRKNMRKSELIRKYERILRRGNSAQKGHKVTELPVLNSASARLGQSLRETQDSLVRDQLESSASIVNCVGGVNGDLPTEMSIEDVDDIVTTLQNNSAEYITHIVEADLKFGTSPIGDSYGCMLTTRMIPVLNNIKGFVRKFAYPHIDQTLSTEWGGVDNVRFFISEQGSVSPSASLLGNDIANCFVAAKESYKVVKQSDDSKSSLIDLEAYDYAEAA